MDAQLSHGGDGEGADVQGRTLGMGNPVLLNLHQSLDGLHKILHRNLGDAQTILGVVHTAGVAVRAEQLNLVFGGAIGLHALKALLRIMEHHGGRVKGDGSIRDDAGIVPALASGIVHDKHVVGKGLTKTQLGLVRGLCLWGSGLRNFDVQHFKNSPLLLFCNDKAKGPRTPVNREAKAKLPWYHSLCRRYGLFCTLSRTAPLSGGTRCRLLRKLPLGGTAPGPDQSGRVRCLAPYGSSLKRRSRRQFPFITFEY
ncbi:hypothetical protein SDC9_118220 [bioreactor metagenome]|uniref:Uncharacterized protein n=1 Tax=bioreactor metagenome TaxID=1076179 RepID=A0A645C1Z9_9ZZZZ